MRKLLTLVLALFLFGFAVISATDVKASSNVQVTVTGIFDETVPFPYVNPSIPHGSNFSFDIGSKPSGQEFAFWIVNGVVKHDLAIDHSFPVTNRMNLQIVFAPTGKYAVVFINRSGQFLGVEYADADNSFTVNDSEITIPVKFGYDVATTPKWLSIEGSTSLTGVNAHSVFVVQYVANGSLGTVNITVNGGVEVGSVPFNSIVNLVPNDPAPGQFFSHWEENDVLVSRNANYAFTALFDRTITAVYSGIPVSSSPVVTISPDLELRGGYHTFAAQVEVPAGFTLHEYGFLTHADAIEIDETSVGVVFAQSNSINDYNEFVTSFPYGTFKSFRAYVSLYNTSSETYIYYYSDLNHRVLGQNYSEGFESLITWSSYPTSDTIKTFDSLNWTIKEVLLNADATDKLTSNPEIHGTQMLRFRGANTAYAYNNDFLTYIESISIDVKYYNASNSSAVMKVWKQVSGGTWTEVQTVSLTDTYVTQTIEINEFDVRVKITVDSKSANVDNIKINGIYVGKVHDVSLVYNNGNSDGTLLVADGEQLVQPSNPSKSGYAFDGWFTNIGLTNPYNFSNIVTDDLTIYARWVATNYTINYNLDGGINDGENPTSYTIESSTITLQPATKDYYTFNGWYDNPGFTGSSVTEITSGQTGNITLYAKFNVNQYTITFEENGGSIVSNITQDYGTAVSTPSNPTKTNFTFSGWFTDDVTFLNQYTFSTMPGQNVTLYAKWIDASGSAIVTFDSNGGSSVDQQVVDLGELAVLPSTPTKTGYTFVNWRTEGEVVWDFGTDTVDEDITLYANWSINQYTITFDSNGGSTVTAITQDYGTDVVAPAAPTKEGYTFDGWHTDNSTFLIDYTFSTMPAQSQTIYAKWIDNTPVEVQLYSTGFESSQSFTASTTYNNTTINSQGPTNQKWGFYFGTPSTTGPITGLQSGQLRYYTATPSNHGYMEMEFTIANVTRVTFKALNTSGNNVKLYYSLNGGAWTGEQTFTLGTTAANYEYVINQTGNIKVKFVLVPGTTNGSRVTIDDVVIFGYSNP